jgi:predicted nucleic acid-binding protein
MQRVLLDSSVYVAALRGEDALIRLERFTAGAAMWLSAVVLEELYAGAGSRDREFVEHLESRFRQIQKVLVPELDDWIHAGKALEQLAARYDYEMIGRGRLTNDALIAMSAARTGIRVITANKKDFRRLAEFRTFDWQVVSL